MLISRFHTGTAVHSLPEGEAGRTVISRCHTGITVHSLSEGETG